MWKCLCLGLTNEHYQDDTRLFGGTRPQSFTLLSAAVICLRRKTLTEQLSCQTSGPLGWTATQLRLIDCVVFFFFNLQPFSAALSLVFGAEY